MKTREKTRWRRVRNVGLCLACLGVGAFGHTITQVFADGSPATATVAAGDMRIPYEGYLMLDSDAAQGTATLRFELFEDASTGTPEWTEEQTVTLRNGRFAVALGSVARLNEVVLDAEKLWLAITVLEDDGMGNVTEVALSGRQLIESTPYAAWSAHAADFDVAGDLRVQGAAAVGDLEVQGDVSIDGDTLSMGAGATSGLGDGGRALAQVATDTLAVNPGGEFTGGVLVGGGVEVAGDLTVLGDSELGDPGGARSVEVLSPLDVSGELDLSSDLVLDSDRDITGLDKLLGSASGLNMTATPSGSPDLSVDASGNVTVAHDLDVTGSISGFSITPPTRTNTAGTTTLIPALAGFCFLTGIRFDHGSKSKDTLQCKVEIRLRLGSSFDWELVNKGGNGTARSVRCDARCVRY